MDYFKVSSQREFELAIESGKYRIELTSEITVDIKVPDGVVIAVKGVVGSLMRFLSGKVEAWGSSHVVARGSSHVVAWESSHVEAWGSSHVVAWAAASLSLFGVDVKAKASSKVVVQLHRQATCDGGVQVSIDQPATPAEWCEWHGVEIVNNHAVLFKGLDSDFSSSYGANYTPGTMTKASDWDGGTQECGKGLHFSPTASATKGFASNARKFVACLVPLDQIAVHPNGASPSKVKAEWCWNWYECDLFGKQIGERFEMEEAAVQSS